MVDNENEYRKKTQLHSLTPDNKTLTVIHSPFNQIWSRIRTIWISLIKGSTEIAGSILGFRKRHRFSSHFLFTILHHLSLSRVTVKLGVLRRRFPRVIYIDRLYKEEGRKGVGRASGVPFFEATTSRRDGWKPRERFFDVSCSDSNFRNVGERGCPLWRPPSRIEERRSIFSFPFPSYFTNHAWNETILAAKVLSYRIEYRISFSFEITTFFFSLSLSLSLSSPIFILFPFH